MANDEIFTAEDPYAPKRKAGCGIVALIVGLVAAGGLLLVACCGGLAYFGMNITAEQVAEDLRGNAVVEEHLGGITSIETNWTATAAAGGEDEFVFDVKGPKGKGRLRVVTQTVDSDTEDVVSGMLETPDGERHDLFPHEEVAE